MGALFGGEASSVSSGAPVEPGRRPAGSVEATKPSTDRNALIAEAAKDLADYQRLTAAGRLREAGQKLEQLKRKLDQLNAREK
jgi:hypothetical protein